MNLFHTPRTLALSILLAALAAAASPQSLVNDSSSGDTGAEASTVRTIKAQVLPRLSPEQVGDLYYFRGRYQAAIATYKNVELPSATVWNKMGVAYQMLLDEKDATRCYKQALKMDPQNANVLNNLATVQDSMMDLAAAEENYRKALKYDPDSAIIHSNLGTNLFLQHKDEEGDEAYRQALTLNPHIFDKNSGPTASNPEAAQELGTTAYYKAKSCARAGLDDCALTYLRKAFDDGAITIKKVSKESDFARLRATEAYSGLIAQEQ